MWGRERSVNDDPQSRLVCVCSVTQSCPTLCNLWAVAHQDLLSMGFSGQEYWSGLPFPPPGDLPDQGIEPESYAWEKKKKKTLLILSNTPKPISFFKFKFKFPFVKSFWNAPFPSSEFLLCLSVFFIVVWWWEHLRSRLLLTIWKHLPSAQQAPEPSEALKRVC